MIEKTMYLYLCKQNSYLPVMNGNEALKWLGCWDKIFLNTISPALSADKEAFYDNLITSQLGKKAFPQGHIQAEKW